MDVVAILTGIAVGLLATGGLFFGMKLLMEAQEENLQLMPPGKRRLRLIFGALVLSGQFLGALAILYFSSTTRSHPVWLGVGMVIAIFLSNLILGTRSGPSK